ncbi:MAG: sedoheptulokinase [Eubacteriales bacterium]
MNVIGIDIGTTSISGINYTGSAEPITASLPNLFETGLPFERIQDPERLFTAVTELLRQLWCDGITGIGITGQMHGILYTDKFGQALSPLYTWQDCRGDLLYRDESYAGWLGRITGCPAASGYGAVTHFYNSFNRLVPGDAFYICTIGDYIAMRLCRLRSPVLHASNAAGIGCFDMDSVDFKRDEIVKAGMDCRLFPSVTDKFEVIGEYRGAAVTCAIGDNQASYIGSARDDSCVLVNIGTGGQISYLYKGGSLPEETELRPLYSGKRLAVGSSLCGGRAYALLERFFRETVSMAAGNACPPLYDVMNLTELPENRLSVSTLFCGTRRNPSERGSVTGISVSNFTPQALIYGTLQSMAEELYGMYRGDVPPLLVGSGNCLRRTPLLRRILSEMFGSPLLIPSIGEEAALGAAFCALSVSDSAWTADRIRSLIEYSAF